MCDRAGDTKLAFTGQGGFPGKQMLPEVWKLRRAGEKNVMRIKQGCQVVGWKELKLSREPTLGNQTCETQGPTQDLKAVHPKGAGQPVTQKRQQQRRRFGGVLKLGWEGFGVKVNTVLGTFSREPWGCALLLVNSCDQFPSFHGPAGQGGEGCDC